MDLVARRIIEQRITIAAAEGLIAAGCSVSVVEGGQVFLADSTDPIAIDAALHASGEPCFQVKRVVDGMLQEGWVDFIGAGDIAVTADENLKLHGALQIANALAVQLGVQRTVQERLKFNREYFEGGCACIHRAKTLQPCPTNMADSEAVAFYEQHCKCSRNYVPS